MPKNANETKKTNETIPPEFLALCPLDGRYAEISKQLSPYFSEFALVKNRVRVEVLWLEFLIENVLSASITSEICDRRKQKIRGIAENFSLDSFLKVKQIESVTNHDVKAVELFVANELKALGMDFLMSFVHFGLTSEDINNNAYATMIADATGKVWQKCAETLLEKIESLAATHASTAMLAHTHGQPATPTTIGKEFAVFAHRLSGVLTQIKSLKTCGKLNGATGNYSALCIAYPNLDWESLSRKFVEEKLQLSFNPLTTQIENHDYICRLADEIRHFNNILLDLDVDIWLYISKGYFKQLAVKSEVGSSTMPHKINPIKFENSEANAEMSNALLMELSNKLPRSRMQRDLSDSSTMRNVGMAIGYSVQSITQCTQGLGRLTANEEKIQEDLENRWEVLAEPIQTVLRKYSIKNAYDKLKALTRGKQISKKDIQKFIKSLDVIDKKDKETLLRLTPQTYLGLSSKLATEYLHTKKNEGE